MVSWDGVLYVDRAHVPLLLRWHVLHTKTRTHLLMQIIVSSSVNRICWTNCTKQSYHIDNRYSSLTPDLAISLSITPQQSSPTTYQHLPRLYLHIDIHKLNKPVLVLLVAMKWIDYYEEEGSPKSILYWSVRWWLWRRVETDGRLLCWCIGLTCLYSLWFS